MDQSSDFDVILNELAMEVARLTTDLSEMSNELQQRKTESAELRALSNSSSVRVAELERTIAAERSGSETALSLGLEREAIAIKERDIWRGISISLGAGVVAYSGYRLAKFLIEKYGL